MSATHEDNGWVDRLRDPTLQPQALEQLRDLLLRGLRRAFLSKASDDAFVEDVTQDALVRILDRLDQFEGRSRFSTWAMSVAVRLATSELRRKRTRDISLDGITDGNALRIEFADESTEQPSASAERNSLLSKLQELIDERLTDRQRWAIQALLNGVPIEEIARRTDSNPNAVYKLVHDARTRLKQGFEQAGYTADDLVGLSQ
ncbi:sigma-70 family RNA polymerase sigma factor [bacterium]|nr:sigma-70 family RNA polymerase sigma factor [bacterium]